MRGDSINYIALPTAFLPDGYMDNKYQILYRNDSFSSFNLSVFKLTGALVFQTTHSYVGWNGNDLTGKRCTDYEYSVKLKYTTIGGKSVDTCTFVYMLNVDTVMRCIKGIKADIPAYKFADQFDPFSGTYPYKSASYQFCY